MPVFLGCPRPATSSENHGQHHSHSHERGAKSQICNERKFNPMFVEKEPSGKRFEDFQSETPIP